MMTNNCSFQANYGSRGQVVAGSMVIFEAGSEIVIVNRNDFSGHGNGEPHDNFDFMTGSSGCSLKGIDKNSIPVHSIYLSLNF